MGTLRLADGAGRVGDCYRKSRPGQQQGGRSRNRLDRPRRFVESARFTIQELDEAIGTDAENDIGPAGVKHFEDGSCPVETESEGQKRISRNCHGLRAGQGVRNGEETLAHVEAGRVESPRHELCRLVDHRITVKIGDDELAVHPSCRIVK